MSAHQFFDNISESFRKRLADLGSCIFRGCNFADTCQAKDRYSPPVINCSILACLLFHLRELDLRIVDQHGKASLFRNPHRDPELFFNLALHCAGAVAHNVSELLILPVEVGNEMLRPLRQVHDCLQIYDLGCCFRDIWILACK